MLSKSLQEIYSVPNTEVTMYPSNARCRTEGYYRSKDDKNAVIKMVKDQAFPTLRKNKTVWILITDQKTSPELAAKVAETNTKNLNAQKKF